MELRSEGDVDRAEELVGEAALQAIKALRRLPADPNGALYALKFTAYGRHPLEPRALNLIEQLNQTFTILASLRAARLLLGWHPEVGGLLVRPSNLSGRDVESLRPGLVEAEVFAAVNPRNNNKLNKDLEKLTRSTARHKYVFFHSPGYEEGRQPPLEQSNIQVWAVAVQGDPS